MLPPAPSSSSPSTRSIPPPTTPAATTSATSPNSPPPCSPTASSSPCSSAPHPNGDGYLVVYGRRRRAAALKAGLTTFPGEVRDRDDLEGLVEFEVRVGSDGDDEPAGCLLFDGELLTTGQGILVGSSLTDLHRVALPIGWYSIQINADQPYSPARFIVTLDGPRSDA